jgi:hypothetical protein
MALAGSVSIARAPRLTCLLALLAAAALWQAPAAGAAIGAPVDLGSSESGSTLATSISLTTTAAVPAGASIIVAAVSQGNSGPPNAAACSDSGGDAYATDVTRSGGDREFASICSTHQLAASLPAASTVTVSWSGGSTVFDKRVRAFAVTGLAPSPLDRTSAASGSNTSPSSGTAAPTGQANELLVGAIVQAQESVSGAGFSPGTNGTANNCAATGTPTYSALPGVGSGVPALFQMYCAVGSIGSYAAQGTLTNGPTWDALLATYKAAPEPPAPPGPSGTNPAGASGQPTQSDPCGRLRKKLKRQRNRLAKTISTSKIAQIERNIEKTKRGLRRHNC